MKKTKILTGIEEVETQGSWDNPRINCLGYNQEQNDYYNLEQCKKCVNHPLIFLFLNTSAFLKIFYVFLILINLISLLV
jgi:hypothetical protein